MNKDKREHKFNTVSLLQLRKENVFHRVKVEGEFVRLYSYGCSIALDVD